MCLFILVCKNRAIHDRAGAATAKGSGGFATGYRTAGQRKRSRGSAVSNAEKQPRKAARGNNDRSGSPCIRSASAGKRQRLPPRNLPTIRHPILPARNPRSPKSLPAFPLPEPADTLLSAPTFQILEHITVLHRSYPTGQPFPATKPTSLPEIHRRGIHTIRIHHPRPRYPHRTDLNPPGPTARPDYPD